MIDEYSRIAAPVIYQHPMAYLLGLEGIALLRAFSGVYDREFTLADVKTAVSCWLEVLAWVVKAPRR